MTTSNEFNLDTESINIYKQGDKPALIQLQILLSYYSSLALVIETCHLPQENQTCFILLQDLFRIIFAEDKKLYIWRPKNELLSFVVFKLFSYEHIDRLDSINLQDQFKRFWNQENLHQSRNSTLSNVSFNNCICKMCLGKNHRNLGLFRTPLRCV